jgi:uncharacterized Zn finger protein
MCKHVAAVLYGVGARLDRQPELLFSLRRVDPQALVAHAASGLPKAKAGPAADKVLDDADLADVFGIEIAEPTPAIATAKRRGRPVKTPAAAPEAKAPAASTKKRKGRPLDETPAVASSAKAKVRAKAKPTTAKVAKRAAKTAKPLPQPAATAKLPGKRPTEIPTGARKVNADVAAGGAKAKAKAKGQTGQPKPSPRKVRSAI